MYPANAGLCPGHEGAETGDCKGQGRYHTDNDAEIDGESLLAAAGGGENGSDADEQDRCSEAYEVREEEYALSVRQSGGLLWLIGEGGVAPWTNIR